MLDVKAFVTPKPITVVDKATRADVSMHPYPHLVIRNALPDAYYSDLSAVFPDLDGLPPSRATANNKRIDLFSSWGPAALPTERVPAIWKKFMADHSGSDFCRKVFDLFPSVTIPGPDSATRWIKMEAFGGALADRLGLDDLVPETDISARTTLAVNTPVISADSVRGPHIDSPRKAYVGYYYLRHPADDSEGGDLILHRWKPDQKGEPWAAKVDDDAIEEIDKIVYAPNTLILLLNTSDSLHSVTVRKPTPHVRRLVVVSGWFPGEARDKFAQGRPSKM